MRVKETDRIAAIVQALNSMGASVQDRPDGFVVEGPTPLRGQIVKSYHDHLLGMALAVAGMIAEVKNTLQDAECIADSFPGFEETMRDFGICIE